MLLTLKPENLQPDIKSHHTQKQAQDKFAHKITVYTQNIISLVPLISYISIEISSKKLPMKLGDMFIWKCN